MVRDLDFNPNRQYYLASCGDDCKVKFWDVRNVQEPVKTLEEHSHWWVAERLERLAGCGFARTTEFVKQEASIYLQGRTKTGKTV